MDLASSSAAAAVSSPAAAADPTPPNGALNRHRYPNHQLLLYPPPNPYKECLKNHAATLGGLALDGCGEFMPSPSAATGDPFSLTCAACGCHRNFHRRDPGDNRHQHRIAVPPSPPLHRSPAESPSPPRRSQPQTAPEASAGRTSGYFSSAPHMLLALRSGGHPVPSVEASPAAAVSATLAKGRRRFRTKFSTEQKDKMRGFAERLGWKMPKGSQQGSMEDLCQEIGINKGVFKVWMHNNKHSLGKQHKDGHLGLGLGFNSTNSNNNGSGNGCNSNRNNSRIGFEIEANGHGGVDSGNNNQSDQYHTHGSSSSS